MPLKLPKLKKPKLSLPKLKAPKLPKIKTPKLPTRAGVAAGFATTFNMTTFVKFSQYLFIIPLALTLYFFIATKGGFAANTGVQGWHLSSYLVLLFAFPGLIGAYSDDPKDMAGFYVTFFATTIISLVIAIQIATYVPEKKEEKTEEKKTS